MMSISMDNNNSSSMRGMGDARVERLKEGEKSKLMFAKGDKRV